MDVVILSDQIVRMKEGKKLDNHKEFVRERTTLWNLKMMVMSLVVNDLRMVSKELKSNESKLYKFVGIR